MKNLSNEPVTTLEKLVAPTASNNLTAKNGLIVVFEIRLCQKQSVVRDPKQKTASTRKKEQIAKEFPDITTRIGKSKNHTVRSFFLQELQSTLPNVRKVPKNYKKNFKQKKKTL